MKKQLLFAALLACTGAFAQMTPSEVTTPGDIALLKCDIPGLRDGFTGLKVRTPVDENTFSTWYDFTIGVTGGVITSTGFMNIDPAKPLDYQARSTGSKTGNTYTAIVEMLDNTWVPDQKQTSYADANGKDTLWFMEIYDATNTQYVPERRIHVKYTASGQFAGFVMEDYDGTDWNLSIERAVTYNGNQRATDTLYISYMGDMIPGRATNYFYNGSTLDSIVVTTTGLSGFEFEYSFKLTTGTDGGVDQVKTYMYDSSNDSMYVESRADFTGGTPVTGVREISTNDINVYPVPAASELNISVKNGGVYQASVFDLQGRKLVSQPVSAQSAINVSELSNGIYILVVENNAGERMQKRIVIGK
jgi:hypothetical protein